MPPINPPSSLLQSWLGGLRRLGSRVRAGVKWLRTDFRVRMVAFVALLMLVLTVVVCGAIYGWHYLPGIWGEWIGMIVGVMSTPFFLEASFIFIGLVIVMTINHYRQQRDGDEFVELDVDDSPPGSPRKPSPRD